MNEHPYHKRVFISNSRGYNRDDYSVAYFNDAENAGKAVAMLLTESIGFDVIVGPGEMWLVVDEMSFCDSTLQTWLKEYGISHLWVKSRGEVLKP